MAIHSNSHYAIGVFDSGLGGLTVVKELIRALPHEEIVYFGDTARVPYGTKSKESIIRFSVENSNVLLQYKVKMIVVACNSCSSYAMPILTKSFPIPSLGVIEAGARKAVNSTRNNRIGVIATMATVFSQSYPQTVRRYKKNVRVFSQACPLFVPVVEEGWINKKITYDIANEYLKSLKKAKIDTLILGCTHYPLLKTVLRKVMGKGVTLIDSAEEVAAQVKDVLKKQGRLNAARHHGRCRFIVSDKPQIFQRIAKNFLGYSIQNVVQLKNQAAFRLE